MSRLSVYFVRHLVTFRGQEVILKTLQKMFSFNPAVKSRTLHLWRVVCAGPFRTHLGAPSQSPGCFETCSASLSRKAEVGDPRRGPAAIRRAYAPPSPPG